MKHTLSENKPVTVIEACRSGELVEVNFPTRDGTIRITMFVGAMAGIGKMMTEIADGLGWEGETQVKYVDLNKESQND